MNAVVRTRQRIERIVLFSIYGIFSYGAIWVFGAGGEGSLFPVPVFCSWAVPLTRLIWPSGGALIFIAIYYISILGINSISARFKRGFLITLGIHFAGVALALFSIRKQEPSAFLSHWLAVSISLIMVIIYLCVDWVVARADFTKED